MNDICGNEEWLAAYLDKRLPTQERSLFEMHLSRCPNCLAELIAAKAELDEMTAEEAEKALATAGASAGRRHPAGARAWFARTLRLAPGSMGKSLGPLPRAAAISIAAVVVCAGAALLSGVLPPGGRDVREARSNISRILETSEIGAMRLSSGPARPVARAEVYRGPGMPSRDLFNRTERMLKAALERHGNDWRIHALLGDLYIAGGQVERAENYYARALSLNPKRAELLNDRAVAEYRLGEFDLSLADLEGARAADDTRLETIYNLGILYRETGHRERSIECLESYLKKDPSSPWAERAKALARE